MKYSGTDSRKHTWTEYLMLYMTSVFSLPTFHFIPIGYKPRGILAIKSEKIYITQ